MAGEPTSEELRLDYDQTTDLLRTLTDVRFKLLAFVPTISGAAIGLLGRGDSAAELLAVGALGLLATLGIVVYEFLRIDGRPNKAGETTERAPGAATADTT